MKYIFKASRPIEWEIQIIGYLNYNIRKPTPQLNQLLVTYWNLLLQLRVAPVVVLELKFTKLLFQSVIQLCCFGFLAT